MPGLSSTVKLFKKKKKEEKRNLFPLSSLIKRTSLRESFSFLSSLPKLKLFPPSEWNRGILGDNKYSSHSEKILWIGGENLLSSSIKKYIYIRDIYRPFVSLKNDIVPDYPSRGRDGRRKKTKRWEGGAGKERRAWITMASMRRANREMREYQGGQIIRERPSYFASSHSHPCQHFMRHGIIHPSPSLPDSPPWAYFVRIVILPTDSNFVLLLEVFRMILEWLIDVCCCVALYSIALEINRSFSLRGVLLKEGRNSTEVKVTVYSVMIFFFIRWKNSWHCTLIIRVK